MERKYQMNLPFLMPSLGTTRRPLHERWITSIFCIVVLAAILIGVRIPAWNKFNAFLLRKAGSNTSEGSEEAMLEVRAAEFEASRGKLIDRTCVATTIPFVA